MSEIRFNLETLAENLNKKIDVDLSNAFLLKNIISILNTYDYANSIPVAFGIFVPPTHGLLYNLRRSVSDWGGCSDIRLGDSSGQCLGTIASAYKYSNGGSASIEVIAGESYYVSVVENCYFAPLKEIKK